MADEQKTAFDYWKQANDRLELVISQNETALEKIERLVILIDGHEDYRIVGLRPRVDKLEARVDTQEQKMRILTRVNIGWFILNVILFVINILLMLSQWPGGFAA